MPRFLSLSAIGFIVLTSGCGTPSAEVQTDKTPPGPATSLEEAFDGFVTGKNDFVSREIGGPEVTRNEALFKEVASQFELHVRSPTIQQAFHAMSADYAHVLSGVRTQGLPDVVAAIPFHESRYQAEALSRVCAKGYWQFIPEVAVREGLTVKDCQMSNSLEPWTPTDTVSQPIASSPYVETAEDGTQTCLIASCATDERTDLAASTKVALSMMAKVYKNEAVIKSGKAVENTILSHNVGAEQVLKSLGSETPLGGGYEAKVIALHLVAKCIYGAHFGDAHNPYKGFQMNYKGSYCEQYKWIEPASAGGDEKPAE